MELRCVAQRECRLLGILRRELSLSSGLVRRLKWQNALFVNGEPAHTDRLVVPGDTVTVLLDEQPEGFPAEPLPGVSDSQRDYRRRARDVCLRDCDEFPENRRRNLLLTGNTGLGKTFLLNCMANRLYARGVGVSYLTAYRMLSAMRESVMGQDSEPFDMMLTSDVLIIDDLGSEPIYRNVTVEMLFTLLNERIRARRHTLIATNLTAPQLLERYGERVSSRLMDTECTLIMAFAGADVRVKGRRG